MDNALSLVLVDKGCAMFRSRKTLYVTIVLAIAFAGAAVAYLATDVTALTAQPDKSAPDRHQDE